MHKALVVGDDEATRDVFKVILTIHGYEVNTMRGGEDLLSNHFGEPDIFIIDKQLTGTDGLDIGRYLKQRARYASTPIIIVSASKRVD